jgi:hypothetical protein
MDTELAAAPRPASAGATAVVDGDWVARYVGWFHDLDAWTEYWDIYHPESAGRFFFGDGAGEPGLLTAFMPATSWPAPFTAWIAVASKAAPAAQFAEAVRVPQVAQAILEVDELVGELFGRYYGDAADLEVQGHYLEAMHRFATDTLPPAPERYALVPEGDYRQRTAGRHTLDGDIMWFAWALHLEAGQLLDPDTAQNARRRALMMAAVATGCAANFAWRGHRRTRPGYQPDERTAYALRSLGLRWAQDFPAACAEVHALYRVREWGHD